MRSCEQALSYAVHIRIPLRFMLMWRWRAINPFASLRSPARGHPRNSPNHADVALARHVASKKDGLLRVNSQRPSFSHPRTACSYIKLYIVNIGR